MLGLEGMLINILCVFNIDEEVLFDVFEFGVLGFVVLDVFEGELNFNLCFLKFDNVFF